MFASWKPVPRSKLALLAGDAAINVYSALITILLLRGWGPGGGYGLEDCNRLIMQAPVYLACFYVADLYEIRKTALELNHVLGIMAGCAVGAALSMALAYPSGRSGEAALVHGAIVFLSVTGMRLAYASIISSKYWKRRILIAGASQPGVRLLREILADECCGFQVVGFTAEYPHKPGNAIRGVPVLGADSELAGIAKGENVDVVVLGATDMEGEDRLRRAAADLPGVAIVGMPEMYGCITGRFPVTSIDERWWGLHGAARVNTSSYLRLKRLADVGFSLLLLALASPALLVCALLIKLDSRGPVLYAQERVGFGGKRFTIYKLRTMVADAERDTGAVWARTNDPRITRVGNVLRKTRLDELPQLVNVVKGDMSIVGPRPEREVFVRELEKEMPLFRQRLTVKPGLTGWAQVMHGYAASVEQSIEKLGYDLYYIKNMSPLLDARIILKTVRVVLLSRGH